VVQELEQMQQSVPIVVLPLVDQVVVLRLVVAVVVELQSMSEELVVAALAR
jgi:hypothetical protein